MEAVNQIEYNGALYNVKDAEAQKSLVYSQNETDTGKIWIDGRKIYRKVILLPAIEKGKVYQNDLSSIMASTYITLYGFLQIEKNLFIPLLDSDKEDSRSNVYISIKDNSLRVFTGAFRQILSGFVVLEYTKTTN